MITLKKKTQTLPIPPIDPSHPFALDNYLKNRMAIWTSIKGDSFGCLQEAIRDAWVLESSGFIVWEINGRIPSNNTYAHYASFMKLSKEESQEIPF